MIALGQKLSDVQQVTHELVKHTTLKVRSKIAGKSKLIQLFKTG